MAVHSTVRSNKRTPTRAALGDQGFLVAPLISRSSEPARRDLIGFRAIAAGLCFFCGGPLRDETGTFSERMYRGREGAFAAASCNECKRTR
jgi:hypothetical protein